MHFQNARHSHVFFPLLQPILSKDVCPPKGPQYSSTAPPFCTNSYRSPLQFPQTSFSHWTNEYKYTLVLSPKKTLELKCICPAKRKRLAFKPQKQMEVFVCPSGKNKDLRCFFKFFPIESSWVIIPVNILVISLPSSLLPFNREADLKHEKMLCRNGQIVWGLMREVKHNRRKCLLKFISKPDKNSSVLTCSRRDGGRGGSGWGMESMGAAEEELLLLQRSWCQMVFPL